MDYTIRFYKTKYNTQNRAYDKQAFANVYPLNTAYEIALPHIVIPDTTIYVNNEVGIELITKGYNYCVFNYGGVDYYSFIVQYIPNIASNSYGVLIATDAWLTFGDKVSITGIIERAHVNEIEKDTNGHLYPINTYYSEDVEEPYLHDTFKIGTTPVNMYTKSKYAFLYVLRNLGAKDNATLRARNYGSYVWAQESEFNKMNTNTTICVYGLNKETGQILPIRFRYKETISGNYIDEYASLSSLNLSNHWSLISDKDYICAMIIDDRVVPNSQDFDYEFGNVDIDGEQFDMLTIISLKYGQRDAHKISIGFDSSLNDAIVHSNELPMALFSRYTLDNYISPQEFSFPSDHKQLYYSNTLLDIKSDFNNYLYNSITKLHTSSYRPLIVSYGSKQTINTLETTTNNTIHIGYDFSFASRFLTVPNRRTLNLSQTTISSVSYQFSPNINNDYWTRLNANNAQANARFNNVKAGLTLLKGTSKVMQKANNALTDWQGQIENPILPSSMVKAPVQTLVSGAVEAATQLTHFSQQLVNNGYAIECAQRTLEEGLINTNLPNNGAMTYNDNDVLITFTEIYNTESFRELAYRLHKYGYMTSINIENYFTNHKRESFNYVQGTLVEVSGLSLDITSKIRDIIAYGCTFWSTEPMNYNVTNYQVNIKEV